MGQIYYDSQSLHRPLNIVLYSRFTWLNGSITLILVCYTAVFSVVMWGGALRDDSKNGCVADYPDPG